MGVVLRCPHCGTTGVTAGECEACHDANVRYFCTAHTPGVWLDTSTCPNCGSQFGDAPTSTSTSTSTSASAPAIAPPRPGPDRGDIDGGDLGERWPTADVDDVKAAAARMPLWQELLRAAARAPYLVPKPLPLRELAPIGRSVGGCLVRIVLILLFLFVALVAALSLFGRALL